MSNNETGTSLIPIFMGAGFALVTTLLLGSFIYTWSETGDQTKEKQQWRDRHEISLDKRFAELKQGQKDLTDLVNKSNDNTKDILWQILEEQRRSNNINNNNNNRNNRFR